MHTSGAIYLTYITSHTKEAKNVSTPIRKSYIHERYLKKEKGHMEDIGRRFSIVDSVDRICHYGTCTRPSGLL